uniref:Ig-like domain-containing protein n=1 Tax=Chelonoidis abingdonii TaxID=106734 RepID=A0A8C0H8P8_CHEAB
FHHLSSSPCPDRLSPVAPSVGQNVTLSVEGGLEPLRHFDWYRGRLADGSTRIFSYFPGQERPQRNGVQFTGREVGFPNGSLLLRGTQANDSGTYQVALQLVPQGSEKGTVELRVSGEWPPYGLRLPPDTSNLPYPPGPVNLTLGSPLTLTCVADSVPALSYSWILNGNKLPQSRSSLTFDLTTGTPHWCHPSPDPVPLCADGPDSARIDLPGLIALTLGSPLTLMCVSDSVPAPSYRWGLNSTDTTETGIILTFNPTTVDHQGTYKCQAHNPITDRTAWASVAMLVTGRG